MIKIKKKKLSKSPIDLFGSPGGMLTLGSIPAKFSNFDGISSKLQKINIMKNKKAKLVSLKKKMKKKKKKMKKVKKPILVNNTSPSDYKCIHCPSCGNQKFSVLKITRSEEKMTPEKFSIKSCKRCGVEILNANYVRFCLNCKNYATCINCVVCPSGHSAHKSEDISLGNKTLGNLYGNNQYNCDSCHITKNVRPYIWRCRTCEWDVCPKHVYGYTHVWKGNNDIEEVEGGVVYTWDPFWDRYMKKALEKGVDFEKDGKCVEGATEVC